ncbi:hypothetical protein FOL47_007232 [Perkinsus chesapeaki]|uniref:Uncharacterized protein n=1 Tax=Perkinsus chesapeaki TaxID=330153 RepID=A0A7J6MWJ6_PERCH|nr:hypothetical protein FOL47_007232 [Perkinsus chesapeaki]
MSGLRPEALGLVNGGKGRGPLKLPSSKKIDAIGLVSDCRSLRHLDETASWRWSVDVVLGRISGYESDFSPYCHLKDLGLWALVDTGASQFQLIWKEWYDSVMSPDSSCAKLYAGCYICKTECDPQHAEIYVNTFFDGTRETAFEHVDDSKIGSVDVGEVKFELVIGQDPPPNVSPVFNLICLGPQSERGFPPLLY